VEEANSKAKLMETEAKARDMEAEAKAKEAEARSRVLKVEAKAKEAEAKIMAEENAIMLTGLDTITDLDSSAWVARRQQIIRARDS